MRDMFTPEERRAIERFHEALAEACRAVPDSENCPRCGMRIYCYSAPGSVTQDVLNQVLDYLENDMKMQARIEKNFQDHGNVVSESPSQGPKIVPGAGKLEDEVIVNRYLHAD